MQFHIALAGLVVACTSTVATAAPTIGALSWGDDPDTRSPWTAESLKGYVQRHPDSAVAKRTEALLKRAEHDVTTHFVIAPVATLSFAGVMPTDPRHIASQAAIDQLPDVFALAVCARIAPAPLDASCQQIAHDGALGWMTTYKSTGNPIDEARLVELFLAIDWLLPIMGAEDRLTATRWMASFVTVGDEVYKAKTSQARTRINNFNTWRLAIRSITANVSGHAHLIESTPPLVDKQVRDNLLKPAQWRRDSKCTNDAEIKDYVGFDFRQRDALTYHLWNIQAWVDIVSYAPENVKGKDRERIAAALAFLKPYYLGQAKHVEFVCSTEPYDAQECKKGDDGYCAHPWASVDKARAAANGILRTARAVFPEAREWTAEVVARSYAPSVEFRAALRGD
jgi:hypothetical protein